MNEKPMKIPFPSDLRRFGEVDGPRMMGTGELVRLLEFWGFTRCGRSFLKKMEACEVLRPVHLRHQRVKRWRTLDVLRFYQGEVGGE